MDWLRGGWIGAALIGVTGLIGGCERAGSEGEGDTAPVVADSASAGAILETVIELRATEEHGKAEALLREAVGQYPGDQVLRLTLAEVLLTRRDFDGALRQYERAIEIGPETAAARFSAGIAATQLDRIEAAAAHFERAAVLDAGNADYAIYRAQSLLKLNDLSGAKAEFVRAAAIDDTRAIAWGALAEIAMRENSPQIAAQHAAKAAALEPAVGAWRVIGARAHKRMGDPERALLMLGAISGTERTSAEVARTEAECFGMLGRPADAAARVVEAARANSEDASLWFDAAVWAQRAGDTESAAQHAGTAAMLGNEPARRLLDDLSR